MTTPSAIRFGICCLLFVGAHAAAQDWPQVSGPTFNRVVEASGLAENWSASPPVRWQMPVGFGQAPVVVSQDRVYAIGLVRADLDPLLATSGQRLPRWPTGPSPAEPCPARPRD